MDDAKGMAVREVLDVLAALRIAGCRCWVAGGWGVDALVGRQTRPHRDLDLALDAEQEATALTVLGDMGYAVDVDLRPVRVEVRAIGRGWVDIHPLVFDAAGNGLQAGLDGMSFTYPNACFVEGSLLGHAVPCLSVDQQVVFHTGYEPRSQDLHDLAILEQLRLVGIDRSSWRETDGTVDDKANLAQKLAAFSAHWKPKIVGRYNDNKVMVVKVQGEFVWHTHDETDDLFLVLTGRLTIRLRDRDVELGPGELFIIPRGVEHCPYAEEEAHVLLIEPMGTVNTGDAGGPFTAEPEVI